MFGADKHDAYYVSQLYDCAPFIRHFIWETFGWIDICIQIPFMQPGMIVNIGQQVNYKQLSNFR